jgi:hypothetical protein
MNSIELSVEESQQWRGSSKNKIEDKELDILFSRITCCHVIKSRCYSSTKRATIIGKCQEQNCRYEYFMYCDYNACKHPSNLVFNVYRSPECEDLYQDLLQQLYNLEIDDNHCSEGYKYQKSKYWMKDLLLLGEKHNGFVQNISLKPFGINLELSLQKKLRRNQVDVTQFTAYFSVFAGIVRGSKEFENLQCFVLALNTNIHKSRSQGEKIVRIFECITSTPHNEALEHFLLDFIRRSKRSNISRPPFGRVVLDYSFTNLQILCNAI